MEKKLINGKENPSSHLDNSFIVHGHSVFTTFLSFKQNPFFLKEHLNRLKQHAQEIGLDYPGDHLFLSDLETLLSLDRFLRIRLTVGPHLRMAQASSFIPPPIRFYTQGVKAICTTIQVHPQLAHLKTGNYLPYLLAKKAAENENAFEGFLLDQAHHIVDASRSSPMLYHENTLTICKGGLDGITRKLVAKKAEELGVQIKEAHVKASDAKGQFLIAGSGIGLICVGTPADQKIRDLIDLFSPHRFFQN